MYPLISFVMLVLGVVCYILRNIVKKQKESVLVLAHRKVEQAKVVLCFSIAGIVFFAASVLFDVLGIIPNM